MASTVTLSTGTEGIAGMGMESWFTEIVPAGTGQRLIPVADASAHTSANEQLISPSAQRSMVMMLTLTLTETSAENKETVTLISLKIKRL